MKKLYQAIIGILAVGLSGFLVEPLKSLIALIPFDSYFDTSKWEWLVGNTYSLLDVIFFLVIFLVLAIIATLVVSRLKSPKQHEMTEEELIDQQLKMVNQLVDEENQIKVTWDVYKGTIYDHDPHPMNINCFCLRHEKYPLKFNNGHCPDFDCPNYMVYVTTSQLKNQIESLLLAKRDELRNALEKQKRKTIE